MVVDADGAVSFACFAACTGGVVPVGVPHGPQLVQQVATAVCSSCCVAVVGLNLAVSVAAHLGVVALFVVPLSGHKPNTCNALLKAHTHLARVGPCATSTRANSLVPAVWRACTLKVTPVVHVARHG